MGTKQKNAVLWLLNVNIEPFREILLKKAKMKAKKKPRRRSDSSGGYTLSDIIQSPTAAGTLEHLNPCNTHPMSSHTTSQSSGLFFFKPSGCFKLRCYHFTNKHCFLSVVSPCLLKSGKANSTESLQELLTSDSEGSYMGVGSPRDMQSPVFHDRAEVNICYAPVLLHALTKAAYCELFNGMVDIKLKYKIDHR